MADMLKFRKGTYAQINAASKAAGTIYIAKDEKAMYVDVDDSTRIRIGDFIRVASIEEIPQPYSETAVYYVEGANALLGYKDGQWKQINGTEELVTRIGTAETEIQSLKGTVGSATSGLVKDMADAKTAIAANTNAIGVASSEGVAATGLHALIEGNAADIVDAESRIQALEETVGTNEEGKTLGGRVTALEGTVSGHTSDISDLNDALSEHVETAEATYAKKTDVYIKSEVYTQAEANDKISAAVLVETNRAKLAEEANASGVSEAKAAAKTADDKAVAAQNTANAAATAASNANTNAESRVKKTDFEAFQITNSEAIKAAKDAADAAKDAASAANANANTRVLKSDFETFQASNTTAIADAKKAGTDAANAFNAYSEEHKNDYDNDTIDTKVKTASDAAATAQAKADSAYSLAEAAVTDTDLTEAIKNFATTSYVDQAETDAIKAAKEAGDLAYAPISLVQAVNGINGTIGNAEGGLVKDIADAKQAAKDANDNANTRVLTSEFNTFKTSNSAAIAAAQTAADSAQDAADANASAISKLQADLKAVSDDYVTESELATVKSNLQAEIAEEINAANAMEYAGGVGSETALDAITNVKAGATYVVTSEFTSGSSNYYAGDLLIATGTEDTTTEDGDKVISNPEWTHVRTGYDASLDQKLTGANNAIKLSTSIGGAGTQVAFTATGSASVSVANNTVTIGMVWEDFE